MPSAHWRRNRLLKEDDLDRAEIGRLPDGCLKLGGDRSFIPFPVDPEFLNDLTQGILFSQFKEVGTGINACPATDAFVPDDPNLHAILLQRHYTVRNGKKIFRKSGQRELFSQDSTTSDPSMNTIPNFRA